MAGEKGQEKTGEESCIKYYKILPGTEVIKIFFENIITSVPGVLFKALYLTTRKALC